MNRKLVMGAVAGVAAIGLAVGGTTYSAFSDYGDINNNSVGAGFLKLNLGVGSSGDSTMNFSRLAPNVGTGRTLWIASNDGQSVPTANLFVTLHNLQDAAAPCSTSLGKASGEQASGIGGCTITGNSASGTPGQGNLSRVLSFQGYYYPNITSAADCAALLVPTNPHQYPANSPLFTTARGDFVGIASGAGTKYELMNGTSPVQLAPGQGTCMGIGAWWGSSTATTGTPAAPTDNAAQGDSLTFDAHFDLVQDLSVNTPQPVNNN